MDKYLHCSLIEAEPMTIGEYARSGGFDIPEGKDPDAPGYRADCPGAPFGAWMPKEAFESQCMRLSEGSKITSEDVENFVEGSELLGDFGNHTVFRVVGKTGFDFIESSGCVDPKNFDGEIRLSKSKKRAYDKIWFALGFMLAWAKNGLNKEE